MNKREFLNNLKKQLKYKVPEEEKEKQVNFYKNYINKELEKGKLEKDIIKTLGDPCVISKSIVFAYNETNNTNNNKENEKKYSFFKKLKKQITVKKIKLILILFLIIAIIVSIIIFFVSAFRFLLLPIILFFLINTNKRNRKRWF